jgi:hypothetical protein
VAQAEQRGTVFTDWEATRAGGAWKAAVPAQEINGDVEGSGRTALRLIDGARDPACVGVPVERRATELQVRA